LRCLAIASLLMLILAAVCAMAAGAVIIRSGEVYTPAEIAVVDHEDSVISRILIGIVKGSDYIKDLLVVKNMDEDDAMGALASGDCAAVVVLPEDFMDDILHGVESHGTIYLSKSASSQSSVVEAVAKFGERLLIAGQAGVFAGEYVIREHTLPPEVQSAFNNESNSKLMDEAIGAANRYFRVEVLDYLDTGMSTASYFALCAIVLLLFMISLFFSPLYQSDATTEMLRRLRTLGVGNARFMRWKIILPAVFRLIILSLTLLLVGEYLHVAWSAASVISLIVSICFITVIGTAVTMCLGDGITSNLIFGVGGMVLTGGLIPRQLLPEAVRVIGDITPFGAAVNIMKPIFGAEIPPLMLIPAVIYVFLAVILINHNLNGTVKGVTIR